MKIIAAILLLTTVASALLSAQAGRIAVLPVHSVGVDPVSASTAESILRNEIGKLGSLDLISEKRTSEALGEGSPCTEADCALEAGKKLDASRVAAVRLSALGEKVIVQYVVVDVPSGRTAVIDQATAMSTEDLDVVMRRVARSVVDLRPYDKGAEVGNITASESVESARRTTRKNFGLSFGYLYPQSGYDDGDHSFVLDGRFDYEMTDVAAGMLIGIRKGFAINLYGSYLVSLSAICPYVGGALGFHWVSHSDQLNFLGQTRPKGNADGVELTAHTGLRLLHTYNFQMIFNLDFIYTMNDYNDKAIVFTLGIL